MYIICGEFVARVITRYKKENKTSYTLGMTLTMELLLYKPGLVDKVFISSNIEKNENTKKLTQLCSDKAITLETNDKAFNVLSPKANCFVIGVFRKFESVLLESSHILLVNPADAGNLGAIMRTAIGFGINNIGIIKPAVDIFAPKTVRASMGALFHMNFESFECIEEYCQKYPNHNLYAFMLNAKNSLKDQKFTEPYTLIFGNEATGLPKEYSEFCNMVKIPHSTDIDSLNLTCAVSIALYVTTVLNWS